MIGLLLAPVCWSTNLADSKTSREKLLCMLQNGMFMLFSIPSHFTLVNTYFT